MKLYSQEIVRSTSIDPNQKQDTIYITSRSEYKYRFKLYQDSLYAYNIGHSVCQNLAKYFRKMTRDNDYDDYFLSPWIKKYRTGDNVDAALGGSEFVIIGESCCYDSVNIHEGEQYSSRSIEGQLIAKEYLRLIDIKVEPCAFVSGPEMPTIYIYKKPTQLIIYQRPCFGNDDNIGYSVLDQITHFIIDKDSNSKTYGKSITPFNIKRYYGDFDKLIKTEWLDPVTLKVIKVIYP